MRRTTPTPITPRVRSSALPTVPMVPGPSTRIERPLAPVLAAEQLLARATTRLASVGLRPMAGGAAGTWTFNNASRTGMLNGTFDFDSDTWKMGLFLSTSNVAAAGTTTYAGVTNEHANANGYTTGGVAITLSLSGTTTVMVDSTDAVWTASGGSIVARYAAIYEVAGNVLCSCLLDSAPADVTVTTGNTLTIAIHASGVFQLT